MQTDPSSGMPAPVRAAPTRDDCAALDARDALRHWTAGEEAPLDGANAVRANQRLLREFLREHLTDGRPLRAFEVWERERWGAA